MSRKILVGSCGGLTGSFLVREFKKNKDYQVLGFDANEVNATKKFLDGFFILPRATDDAFVDGLLKVLNENDIDYYFPTHSKETCVIAENEDYLRANWGGKFIVSPFDSYEKLDSKHNSNRYLAEAGVPVPKEITELLPADSYPVFMKPEIGSGSSKAQIIENRKLHGMFKELYPDACFFEYIKGQEFTVDCLFDNNGRLVAFNQRKRVKSMGGAVIITQNDYSFDIGPYLRKIEKAFTIKGCTNFQFILRDGIPYFTDVNLRYASGGLPLTVNSGIDIPKLLLDILDGKEIGAIESNQAPDKIMYRYFEEWYEN